MWLCNPEFYHIYTDELFGTLLSRGRVNANIVSNSLQSPLMMAAARGDIECVCIVLLMRTTKDESPLLKNIQPLIGAQDRDGNTTLHYFVKHRDGTSEDFQILAALLKAGADITIKNRVGESPLSLAQKKFSDNSEIMQLFNDSKDWAIL